MKKIRIVKNEEEDEEDESHFIIKLNETSV